VRHDHGSQFMSADFQAELRSVVNQRPHTCSHAVWRRRVPAWIHLNSGGPAGP
jgi:hypothetical protein